MKRERHLEPSSTTKAIFVGSLFLFVGYLLTEMESFPIPSLFQRCVEQVERAIGLENWQFLSFFG